MFIVRWLVVILGAVLLLAGCTSASFGRDPSPSPDEPASLPATVDPMPMPMPMPTPSFPVAGSEFVTTDIAGFGLRPGTGPHPLDTWAMQYCEMAGLSPCTGIADRGEPLCIEMWDCHPALLVEFDQGPAAFVSGGIFPGPVVYAVWHAEYDAAVAPFGGARQLLDAYLISVNVCPNAGGPDPRGKACPKPQ